MTIHVCLVETLTAYAITEWSVLQLIISQKSYNDGLTTLYEACCFYSIQLIN